MGINRCIIFSISSSIFNIYIIGTIPISPDHYDFIQAPLLVCLLPDGNHDPAYLQSQKHDCIAEIIPIRALVNTKPFEEDFVQ